jgi:phosphoglycerate kinase
MAKKTIDQVDVKGRRVLMRVDFNVPLDGERITDDRRIRMSLPSIQSVISRGGRLILMSHLGRPSGKGFEPEYSLKPAAARLDQLLPDVTVKFVGEDCIGEAAAQAVNDLGDGEVLLLDNLRFHPGEKKGDEAFGRALADYADIYCNNAFGTAHRPHASMYTVPKLMGDKPKVAGDLLEKELQYLAHTIEAAQQPFIAVLGGAKVSDKMGAITNLAGKVSSILIGGAMAYTFLKAKGVEVGNSRVEDDRLDEAARMLEEVEQAGTTLMLPTDHACATEIGPEVDVQQCEVMIESPLMGLDIGPGTIVAYGEAIRGAKTIVWNGPMGVFEVPPFDAGTKAVAEAIAQATDNGAVSVIGGGDSAAAIEQFGLAARVSHVSTGGGASLEMLEGRSFESVDVLDEA